MKLPTIQDLDRTKMDQRRTIATEGAWLKHFTRDHYASRLKNQKRIYKSIRRSK